MQIIDFKVFVKNWKAAHIEPSRKRLEAFVKERAKAVKKVQSGNPTEPELAKAVKEEKYIAAIIELDEVYSEFVEFVDRKLNDILIQYADTVNEGAKIMDENEFLKSRLKIMDEREFKYLELLKK